jgi:hypothetical protein
VSAYLPNSSFDLSFSNTFAKTQSGLKHHRIQGIFRAKWLKSILAKVLSFQRDNSILTGRIVLGRKSQVQLRSATFQAPGLNSDYEAPWVAWQRSKVNQKTSVPSTLYSNDQWELADLRPV